MEDALERLKLKEIRLRTELCFLLSDQVIRDESRVRAIRGQLEAVVELKRELLRERRNRDRIRAPVQGLRDSDAVVVLE